MNYLGRVFGNLRGFYSGINGATLTGAIDVVVVEQEDGTFKCSPFHVRFGKLGVLRSKEKVVDIEVNGVPVPIRMKLGDTGEAFFVQEVDSEEELDDEYLATSPLPGSPRQMDFDGQLQTISSEETTPTKTSLEVTISIEDEEVEIAGTVTPVAFESLVKAEDGKGRKRRKKKRRNQGSKSDIKIDILESPLEGLESSEPIFRMDEELSNVSEALKNLDTLTHNRSFHRDFYSDTEVEATSTPPNSRPATPIQSDSEYEISKTHKSDDGDVGKWVWGELPSTGTTTPSITPTASGLPLNQLVTSRTLTDKGEEQHILLSPEEAMKFDGENKSMLSGMAGMFSFMKRNNQQGASSGGDPGSSGIYLDDLNLENMDPEVAALYFPTYQKEPSKPDQDEDGESGKGSSLPQSPAPGSSPKTSQIASHMEEHRKRNESSSSESQSKFEAISLCGNSLGLFEQSQLSYDELVENPELLLSSSPESIVVKIDGKFVPWSAALPQILSTTFFKRPLPQNVYQRLIDHYVKKEEGLGSEGSGNVSSSSSTSKDAASKKGFSWFSWRKPQDPEHSTENPLNASPDSGSPSSESNSPNSKTKGSPAKMIQNGSLKQHIASVTSSSDESEGGGGVRGKPDRIGRSSTLPASIPGATSSYDKYKKTLRLNSDQIAALGLKSGQNEAVFSVTTAYQGTSVARCHIYLWRYDDRVVVSDIDGTITKSDVLGHILPIIGKDWAQSGVAQLFTQIHANGYKMLYLSARAIGQAAITREYLKSIRQGDVTLPDGPLLLNPTSLMAAFHREVIEKKPEEFKIACLKDIQTLFPRNPFYAGYGNRINDVYSYRAVDINISRIFTINHKGELRHALTNTFQSSYTSLVELAEHIFPAYKSRQSFTEIDGYSTFEFWREPLPPIASPVDKTPEELRFGRPRSNTVI